MPRGLTNFGIGTLAHIAAQRKRAALLAALPITLISLAGLYRDDRHDLPSLGVDDQDLVADDDIFIPVVFGSIFDEIRRHVIEAVIARHVGADEDREANARHPVEMIPVMVERLADVNPLSLRELHDGPLARQFLVAGANFVSLDPFHRSLLEILLIDDGAIARDVAVDRDVTIEILLADGDAVLVLNAHGIASIDAGAGLGMKFGPAARIDVGAAARTRLPRISFLILLFSADRTGSEHEESSP